MALNINRKGLSDKLAQGASSAKGAIGKAAAFTKENAVIASDKASEIIREQKERWYNPVFLEDYLAEDFDMPKLIVIEDEDERKGNEICEGAIGWLNTRRVPEIIFMYEEFVPKSGIRFSPRPMCKGVYYRHPFEHDLYLQVKDYLKICKNDQLTELKHIACLLGATHCSVEVHQEMGLVGALASARNSSMKSKAVAQRASADSSQMIDVDYSANETLSIVMNESFEPGAIPQRPQLQWFAHDNEILSLIEKRCNPDAGGVMSSYCIDITASTTSSMSVDLASSIDASLKAVRAITGGSLSADLKKEEKKRFVFRVEF